MPLRVNIPSQVFLISLEREGRKRKRRKIYIKTRRKNRKERRCQENANDLRSRGTRAQTQIKEHQIKKIRKGQKGIKENWGRGRGCNKYISPNFKALMMINFKIKAEDYHLVSRAYRG